MPLIPELNIKKLTLNQIVSVAILIIAAFIAILIYRNQSRNIKRLNNLVTEQQLREQTLSRINKLNKEIENNRQKFHEKDIRQTTKLITDLITESKIKMVSLKVLKSSASESKRAAKKKKTYYDSNSFLVVVQINSFHELGEFVSRIENRPELLLIDLLEIKRQGKKKMDIPSVNTGELLATLIISELFFVGT